MEAGEDQARRRQGRERDCRRHADFDEVIVDMAATAAGPRFCRRTHAACRRRGRGRRRDDEGAIARTVRQPVQSDAYIPTSTSPLFVQSASAPHPARVQAAATKRDAPGGGCAACRSGRRGHRRRRRHLANAGTDTGTDTGTRGRRHRHPADADTGTPRTPTPAAAAAPRGAAVLAAPPRPRTASPAPPCAAPPAQPRPSSSRSAPSAARHSRCTASSCSPGVALGFFGPCAWRGAAARAMPRRARLRPGRWY